MKKQILKSALIAMAGVGLLAGSALAIPTDADYFTITDSNTHTTPVINTIFDWVNAQAFFLPSGNEFGIYSYTDPNTTKAILASAHSSQLFFQNILGTWYVDYDSNVASGGTAFDNTFGFYYKDVSGIHYTDASLNVGGVEKIRMDYEPVVATATFNYDYMLLGQTYTNCLALSIETHDVAPVPEPATMLLFGTGLAGLAAIGRRRKTQA